MAIVIESDIEDLTPGLKFDLERRLGRLQRKASDSIRRVKVSLVNVKRPQGVIVKQCRLFLTVVGAPKLMVVAEDKTVEKAYVDALKIADSTMASKKASVHEKFDGVIVA